MTKSDPDTFTPDHNHQRCIRRAVSHAIRLCEERGLRFTGLRKRVLELVWANHEPVTAYDLLKELRREKENAVPPTVYRALDFLTEIGLVHRIESLNAYIGCDHPEQEHPSQFMICNRCHQAMELPDHRSIGDAIAAKAREFGFRVSSQTVEITGICRACQ